MRRNPVWALALGAVVAASAMAAVKTTRPQEQRGTHTVVRGETVSLICLRLYGYYSDSLGAAILQANPDMGSLHLVRVGQKLRLPGPAAEARLFEKRLDVSQGVVTYVEGGATLRRGQEGPIPLGANTVVAPGDVIETGATGRVEVIVNRESVVRLDANTRLTLQAFRDTKAERSTTRVQSSLGVIWTRVRQFKDRLCRFELELPTAVAGVHGTVYETEVSADSGVDVKVYSGEVSVAGTQPAPASAAVGAQGEVPGPEEVPGPDEVPGPQEVTMEEWVQIVREMQRIHIDPKGRPTKPVRFVKKADEWEHFNEERDRQIADIVAGLLKASD